MTRNFEHRWIFTSDKAMSQFVPHLFNLFLVSLIISIYLWFWLIRFLKILAKLVKIKASELSIVLFYATWSYDIRFLGVLNILQLELLEVYKSLIILLDNLSFFDFALPIGNKFWLIYDKRFRNPWKVNFNYLSQDIHVNFLEIFNA